MLSDMTATIRWRLWPQTCLLCKPCWEREKILALLNSSSERRKRSDWSVRTPIWWVTKEKAILNLATVFVRKLNERWKRAGRYVWQFDELLFLLFSFVIPVFLFYSFFHIHFILIMTCLKKKFYSLYLKTEMRRRVFIHVLLLCK